MKKSIIIASLLLVSSTVFAATTPTATLDARIAKGKDHANQEIDRRIEALNDLGTHINGIAKVGSEVKASLTSAIQNQISLLTGLKTKIAADTDITTLKADIKSITQSYRIFMVVIPQGRVAAAADVVDTTADLMTTLSGKLQAKITQAQNAGKDVSALNTLLTDMNAKIADSKTQATAAVGYTANLKPDNGDKTVMASNKVAFDKARADLKVARSDFKAAREDARKIISGLKTMGVGVTATTTAQTQ